MADTGNAAVRDTQPSRSTTTLSTLRRKAAQRAAIAGGMNESLEDIFPDTIAHSGGALSPTEGMAAGPADGSAAIPEVKSVSAPLEPTPNSIQGVEPCAAPWTDEDEQAFQALKARRQAAGYQRRGRDVARQCLQAGKVTPNAGTVSAVLVGLMANAGSMTRTELIDLMAKTSFPHSKARPTDKGWCQGYVAGAIRAGFLTVSDATIKGEE